MKIIKLLIVDLLLFIFVFSAEAQIVVTSTTASSYGPPTVTTNSPSSITENTVVLGGTITNNGGQPITEKGICWSDSKDGNEQKLIIKDDSESDSFESKFQGFSDNTSYYVRAYASNAAGTSYGKQLEFKTKKGIVRSIREKGLVIRPEIGVGIPFEIFPVNAICNVSYQFNPIISIGGGTGIYYIRNFHDRSCLSIPIYANVRSYFCNRKVSPYFDLKLGYILPIIRQNYYLNSWNGGNQNWNDYNTYKHMCFSGFYSNCNLGLEYKNFDFAIEMDLIKQKGDRTEYRQIVDYIGSVTTTLEQNYYPGGEDELYFSLGFKFCYNFQIKKKK